MFRTFRTPRLTGDAAQPPGEFSKPIRETAREQPCRFNAGNLERANDACFTHSIKLEQLH